MIKVYTDGGARGNPGPAASAFVIEKDGKSLAEDSKYLGKKTNNFAEYQALIMAFEWLSQLGEKIKEERIDVFLDSELIVKQMTGIYKIKNATLKVLAMKVKQLENDLPAKLIFYHHIKREKNTHADRLVNEELDKNAKQK